MTTAVIGLGNHDRGDDAVGLVVADRLMAHTVAADVRAWDRPELDLLELLPRYDRVVLVDAVRSGATPGTVHAHPALASDAAAPGSHGFGLAAVLELAGVLGRLPGQLQLLLVEIGPVEHGRAMTPAVRAAAEEVVSRLLHELTTGDVEVSLMSPAAAAPSPVTPRAERPTQDGTSCTRPGGHDQPPCPLPDVEEAHE